MSRIFSLLGCHTPFDPDHRYTTSPLLPPFLLSLVRLLLSLYAFLTTFTTLGYENTHDQVWNARASFSFFTTLTYWGLAWYFLFAGLHTFSYARTGSSWLQGWPRALQAAHAVFYSSVVTFPLLVTVVFWGVLYDGTWFPTAFLGWYNISQHALNSLFAIFEILFASTNPPPLFHLTCLIFILACYLALAYITHATQGFYPYSFLDPKKGSGRVAGYCFGILAAICVIFGSVWCLIWARNWAARKMGLEGKVAAGWVRDVEEGGRRDMDGIILTETPK